MKEYSSKAKARHVKMINIKMSQWELSVYCWKVIRTFSPSLRIAFSRKKKKSYLRKGRNTKNSLLKTEC